MSYSARCTIECSDKPDYNANAQTRELVIWAERRDEKDNIDVICLKPHSRSRVSNSAFLIPRPTYLPNPVTE